MNIGIIGHGVVGKAYESILKKYNNIFIRDKKYENTNSIRDIVENCSIIFVSVNTPLSDKGIFDSTNIDDVMYSLNKELEHFSKSPIVIIKSAVVPLVIKKYKRDIHNLRIVVSPEYLRENNAFEDVKNNDFCILGGREKDVYIVKRFLNKKSDINPNTRFFFCGPEGASFIKYMENSFLATKVTFMNEFYKLYKELEIDEDWDRIVGEGFHMDNRMGNSHYKVPGPDEKYGWGGSCLPKDTESIIKMASQLNVNLELLKNVLEINKKHREENE